MNWGIMKNPLNWLTIAVILYLVGFGFKHIGGK